MYELIFDEKAIQILEKFHRDVKIRIFKKLQLTKENPHRYFEKL